MHGAYYTPQPWSYLQTMKRINGSHEKVDLDYLKGRMHLKMAQFIVESPFSIYEKFW